MSDHPKVVRRRYKYTYRIKFDLRKRFKYYATDFSNSGLQTFNKLSPSGDTSKSNAGLLAAEPKVVMRIIQVSDTHLSPGQPRFDQNWGRLVAALSALEPDLVVHTGDLCLDGADAEVGDSEFAHAMAAMAAIDVPLLIVPGNHDVGHLPGSYQPVDAERLARWRRHVGPDRSCIDRGGWRLIGLNGLLFGQAAMGGDPAAVAAEAEQWDFLEDALTGRAGQPVAIFSHKPIFLESEQEAHAGYWTVPPADRDRLLALLRHHDVRLHASGHLHFGWCGALQRMSLVWGPSSAFVMAEDDQIGPGVRQLGVVVHDLAPDGAVTSRLHDVPGLVVNDFGEIGRQLYGIHANASAGDAA